MKITKFASLGLAAFLHVAPMVSRVAEVVPGLSAGRVAVVLQWVVGALAVAGTYHTVSAASAVLQSPSTIQGKVGTTLSYQIRVTGRNVGFPESWTIDGQNFNSTGSTTAGMPPGLTMSLGTGIIRGSPTQGGTFPVTITAYEYRNQQGPNFTFTLTFDISGGASPPTITTQPAGGTVMEGGSFTFTVVAAGSGLSYEWQHGGTAVAGATSPTLTLNRVTSADAGDYSVTVSNSAGTVTSSPAALAVTRAAAPTSIIRQPSSVSLHAGEPLSLAVQATGTGSLTYQWQRDGTALPNQTAATLSIPAVAGPDAGAYTVVVSGADGSVTSSAATVTVVPLTLQMQGMNAGGATLVLTTIPGRQYTVQATDSLSASAWQNVGSPTASGSTTVFVDPSSTGAQRFWRYQPALPLSQ